MGLYQGIIFSLRVRRRYSLSEIFKMELPIAYVKETYREKEEVDRKYSAKQARDAALEKEEKMLKKN